MYPFLGTLRTTRHHFPQSTEPYAQHVLIPHWLNVDYVGFLAVDFAASVQVSLEAQADMKGGRGYLWGGTQKEEPLSPPGHLAKKPRHLCPVTLNYSDAWRQRVELKT